jgi:hypothetical protein
MTILAAFWEDFPDIGGEKTPFLLVPGERIELQTNGLQIRKWPLY